MSIFYTFILCLFPNIFAVMLTMMVQRPETMQGRKVLVAVCTFLHYLGFWLTSFLLVACIALYGDYWISDNTVLTLAFIVATPLSMYGQATIYRLFNKGDFLPFNALLTGAIGGLLLMLTLMSWAANQPEFTGEEAATLSTIESSIA